MLITWVLKTPQSDVQIDEQALPETNAIIAGLEIEAAFYWKLIIKESKRELID